MNAHFCKIGKYDKENDTCFTIDQLITLSKAYNRYITKTKLKKGSHDQSKINLIKISNNKKSLLEQFKLVFDKLCNGNDNCLIKQKFMSELLKEERDEIIGNFKKEGPVNTTEWLSNIDIDGIFESYKPIYPDFKFLGAVPLDCYEISFCSLHNINFEKLANKRYNKVGIVFNLDTHGMPGSHWVALFIIMDKAEAYYSDSTGKKAPRYIKKIVDVFSNYCKNNNKKCKFEENNVKYQFDSSECGVYSCNFIIRMLSGESFKSIIKNPLNFKQINGCRGYYFLPADDTTTNKPHNLCDPAFFNRK
jgi:hypothetical protein